MSYLFQPCRLFTAVIFYIWRWWLDLKAVLDLFWSKTMSFFFLTSIIIPVIWAKRKKKKTLQGSAASQNGCLCKTNSWRNVLTRLWQEVVAVFHTISSVMWGFHKFNGDCSQQVTFNQLPLLELFHSLIYLFILTIGFLSFSPHQFLLQGGWGDRKWWILSRGLVRCCENPLGPSNSSVSTFYAHTSLHLSLRYHKNQLIRPAKH